jgi:hypothetical protein
MRAISIKMGLWMLMGFVGFFLLAYLLGFGQRSELRIFNGVIHIYCLYLALQAYQVLHPESSSNYVSSVALCVMSSVIGVVGFTLFMTIFLSIDTSLMNNIRQNSQLGLYLNPFTSSLYILAEGLAVSIIGSYILARVMDMNVRKV